MARAALFLVPHLVVVERVEPSTAEQVLRGQLHLSMPVLAEAAEEHRTQALEALAGQVALRAVEVVAAVGGHQSAVRAA